MAQSKGRRSAKSGTTRGTAPSSADLEHLEKMEASEEAKSHQASDVDAMGQDKRRQVVGHSYGPSRRSQILFFIAVASVLLLVIGGWFVAVAAFDTAPDEYSDEAPWSAADAQQVPTRDPSGPCGEPGNPYPFPADSACASGTSSESEKPAAGTPSDEGNTGRAPGQEQGSGGVTNSGGEAGSSGSTAEGN